MTTIAVDPSTPENLSARPEPLSPGTIALVLCLGLAVFAFRSAQGLLHFGAGELSGYQISFSNRQLGFVVAYEAVIGAGLLLYFRRRGWRLTDLTRPFTLGDLPRGLLVWLLAIVLAPAAVAIGLTWALNMDVKTLFGTRILGELHLALMVLAVAINPFYEELIYFGFVPAAFPNASAGRIVVLSTALRVLIHTYQGVLTFLLILPMGLVFAAYYMRTRRLWPIILAHALQDAIGFSVLSSRAG
jgi:membrane protease YdiL (CAAX protease family)